MPAMRNRLLLALALACALAPAPALANDYRLGPLVIADPWARPTLTGQSVGGGYLSIHNTGTTADRLLGGSMPGAATVEVHEMRMDGDVMRMRELKSLDLPTGRLVKLEPGGLHLMLTGLKAPLKIGDKLPLKLRFEKAGEIDVVLHVQSKPTPAADAHKR